MHRFAGAALLLLCSGCRYTTTVQTISPYGGTPIAGVEVQANGGEWIATDAQGEATLSDLWPLSVLRVHQVTTDIQANGPFRLDEVWVLRNPERNPVVVLVDGAWVHWSSASVTGSVSGGHANGVVTVYATEDSHSATATSGLTAGSFDFGAVWAQPGPHNFVLRAVETDGASPPGGYLGYGELAVTLTDPGAGGSLSGVAIPIEPVLQGVVEAHVVLPPRFDPGSVVVTPSLNFPGGGELSLGTWVIPAPFSFPFPQISGAEAWLSVWGVGGEAGALASSVHEQKVTVPSSVTFRLPAPAQLVEPATEADIAAGTTFRWSSGASGEQAAFTMNCFWTDGTGTTRFVSYRALEVDGTEASLPELPGLTIDPGATCSWKVYQYPSGYHLGAVMPETPESERRYSWSEDRRATFR